MHDIYHPIKWLQKGILYTHVADLYFINSGLDSGEVLGERESSPEALKIPPSNAHFVIRLVNEIAMGKVHLQKGTALNPLSWYTRIHVADSIIIKLQIKSIWHREKNYYNKYCSSCIP